jgi:uncharacterized protein (TIGR03086 family)
VLELHGRTLRHSVEIVAAVRDDQWDLPTPCTAWTVRDLLTHMIRENRGFAAAADGETTDRSAWTSPIGDDPRADYAACAERVVASFGADGVLDRTVWLPLIRDGITIPARQALRFHLLDYLVHGWDVAVSIGRPVELPDDVVAAVHGIALREVPDGPRRHRVGASFGPPQPIAATASTLDRLLAHLGRDPGWRMADPQRI